MSKKPKIFECKECGKQFCYWCWADKHNKRLHDGNAWFKRIGKFRKRND